MIFIPPKDTEHCIMNFFDTKIGENLGQVEDIEEVSIENVTEELVENKNEIKEEKINTTAPKKQITTSEMFGYHWMGQIFDY